LVHLAVGICGILTLSYHPLAGKQKTLRCHLALTPLVELSTFPAMVNGATLAITALALGYNRTPPRFACAFTKVALALTVGQVWCLVIGNALQLKRGSTLKEVAIMVLELVNVKNSKALYDELNNITKVSVVDLGDVVYVKTDGVCDLLVLAVCLKYGDVVS
jgi:hypothetical protein